MITLSRPEALQSAESSAGSACEMHHRQCCLLILLSVAGPAVISGLEWPPIHYQQLRSRMPVIKPPDQHPCCLISKAEATGGTVVQKGSR